MADTYHGMGTSDLRTAFRLCLMTPKPSDIFSLFKVMVTEFGYPQSCEGLRQPSVPARRTIYGTTQSL